MVIYLLENFVRGWMGIGMGIFSFFIDIYYGIYYGSVEVIKFYIIG